LDIQQLHNQNIHLQQHPMEQDQIQQLQPQEIQETLVNASNTSLEEMYALYEPTYDPFLRTYPFGSKNRSKMLGFSQTVNLGNEVIDMYMSMKPQRLEYETKEQYKKRTILQSHMLKYRGEIYNWKGFKTGKQKKALIKLTKSE